MAQTIRNRTARCLTVKGDEMDADEAVLAAAREYTDNVPAIENAVLFCIECETRFHMEETTHCFSLSTD